MTEINELKSWIAHAEDDFESAKVLIRRKKTLTIQCMFPRTTMRRKIHESIAHI